MSRVGIYSVDSTELSKPPSERHHEQKGLYDLRSGEWSDSTDDRLHYLLPERESQPYTREEIQDAIESATLHVYTESEVPGYVSRTSSSLTTYQAASD